MEAAWLHLSVPRYSGNLYRHVPHVKLHYAKLLEAKTQNAVEQTENSLHNTLRLRGEVGACEAFAAAVQTLFLKDRVAGSALVGRLDIVSVVFSMLDIVHETW